MIQSVVEDFLKSIENSPGDTDYDQGVKHGFRLALLLLDIMPQNMGGSAAGPDPATKIQESDPGGPPKETTPNVLNVGQAAEYLKVSTWTVREYCAQGVLPHKKIGRRILFSRVALDEWMQKKT